MSPLSSQYQVNTENVLRRDPIYVEIDLLDRCHWNLLEPLQKFKYKFRANLASGFIQRVSDIMRGPQSVKKIAWSSEEDQKLIHYIRNHGIWTWSEMAKYAGLSRSGKSCRLRWVNYLNPRVKRGNITMEEEKIISTMHKMLGNRYQILLPICSR
ncbi:hypothetical protein RJ639_018995 [Escallonia herrerae]|uniref:Uncharacterized protein n=1 Tax=Escallonia herrerae TaxID=1293975 RepID=A0AA88V6D7_9ASTE|nr:hypothetical protein RJ639_018995 [Escallonia herrerae]